MNKWIAPFALTLLIMQISPAGAGARTNAPTDNHQPAIENNWLMMVKTRNTDPAKDAEFNDWYNKVDIPDVLKVPGYLRARRGAGQIIPAYPSADLTNDKGRYIALYNIKTANMDKTIIDMLMASWEMDKTGHSTNLLQVTERVYYHQYSPTAVAAHPQISGPNKYLYVVKIKAAATEQAQKQLDKWYDQTYVPAILKTTGFVRTTRYQLYRVLMTKPVEIPGYLAIFEIAAAGGEQALADLHKSIDQLTAAGRMDHSYTEESAALYQTVKDVSRR